MYLIKLIDLKGRRNACHFLALLLFLFSCNIFAQTFNVTVIDGKYFGPNADQGLNQSGDQLRNLYFVGSLEAVVPFFNNGPLAPNVAGEVEFGDVDGLLSDQSTKINENVDAAFSLLLNDTQGEYGVLVAVVDGGPLEGNELLKPDINGNLTANIEIAWDSNSRYPLIRDHKTFTTGAVFIPKSMKTYLGRPGGKDHAGPYPSGSALIGRLGDFDLDGYLDGTFVTSSNTPMALPGAEGDPDLLIRTWVSDIPIGPLEATYANVNGIVVNFEPIVERLIKTGQSDIALFFIDDLLSRIDAAFMTLNNAISQENNKKNKNRQRQIRKNLGFAESYLKIASYDLLNRNSMHLVKKSFKKLRNANSHLADLSQL